MDPHNQRFIDLRDPDGAAHSLDAVRGPIDFRELRSQVTIADVLRELGWSPVERRGIQARGPCPVHVSSNERSRSLSVNLEKNVFQCFAGCCGAKGNQLDLYAAARRIPLYEAAIELCDRLGLPPPRPR